MKYFFALWVFISFSIPAFFAYSQSLPSYVPTNRLIGWWGFNGNAQDASGNGNHGMANGAISTADRFGNLNSAYSFDGLDDYIQTSAIGPSGNSSRSFTFWIKTANTAIQTPIDYYGQFGTSFQAILNSPCPGLGIDGAFGVVTRGGPFLINNEWHHCALVFDSQIGNTISDVKIYIDGNLQPTITCSAVNPNLIINTSDPGAFVFGKTTSNLRFVDGNLDDIGIWNRALNQQEINNLYNSQLPNQTSLCLPTISTNTPTSIGIDSVIVGGNITNDGGSPIVLRGVCYSTTPNPNMGNVRTEDGSGVGSFSTILRNLSPSTTYYLKSYAKNSIGVVVYGDEVSFSTGAPIPGIRCPGTPSVTDIDGNLYHTVQIGNQCWIQSNLKTSRYRNGDSIPMNLMGNLGSFATGSYYIYNNDSLNNYFFGKLYNHYAVTDSRGLCPTGWKVPSDTDWTVLSNNFGGDTMSSASLRATDTLPTPFGWASPNLGATNNSGFTALPGGHINMNGLSGQLNLWGFWWTSTTTTSFNAWYRIMHHEFIHLYRYDQNIGRTACFSVRCIKENP